MTPTQRRRRSVSRALAEAGYVEVLPFPFVSPSTWDDFGLADDDPRRRSVPVLNPLESEKNQLATTLLPGLLETLQRNISRGFRDVALYHVGQVVLPGSEQTAAPDPGVDRCPSDDELAALERAVPDQPVHVAVVLAGERRRSGWWGKGEAATWADAVQAARLVGEVSGVDLDIEAAEVMPWHPGRCARLSIDGRTVGYAGELHPKVVEKLGLPKRTAVMELDLDAIPVVDRKPAPFISPFPPVLLDVALVVDTDVSARSLAAVLREGAGELVEDVSLFDLYEGEQIGEGKRSLAYKLRFRAPDRTLTVEEATKARDAAVALAGERFGAVLRG